MNTISKLSIVLVTLSLVACGPYEDYPSQETTVAKGGTTATSASSTGGKTSATSSNTVATGGNVGATGGATISTGNNNGTGGTNAGTETSPTVKADAGVSPDTKTSSPDAATATDVSIMTDSAPTGGCKEGETTTGKVFVNGKPCDVTYSCTGGILGVKFDQSCYASDASTGSDVLPPAPDTQTPAVDTTPECTSRDHLACWVTIGGSKVQVGTADCVDGHYQPCPVILGTDGGTSDAQAPAIDSQPAVDTQPALDTGTLDTQVLHDAIVSGADALVAADTQVSADAQPFAGCGNVPENGTTPCQAADYLGNISAGIKFCQGGMLTGCIVPNQIVINCTTTAKVVNGVTVLTNTMQVTGDALDNLKQNSSCPAGLNQQNLVQICASGKFNNWTKTGCQNYVAALNTYAFLVGGLSGTNEVTFIGTSSLGDAWSWNQTLLFEVDPNNLCKYDDLQKLTYTTPLVLSAP